ncbi:hypothetical protein MC885_021743 [Smutsia gigantea]|nr:hypothetical protein MC885_021743 [Smutsia gigantea]
MQPAPGPESVLLWEAAGGQTGASPGGSRPAAHLPAEALPERTVGARLRPSSAFLRPLPPSQNRLERLLPVLFPFRMPGPAWAPGLVAGGQGTLGPVSTYF